MWRGDIPYMTRLILWSVCYSWAPGLGYTWYTTWQRQKYNVQSFPTPDLHMAYGRLLPKPSFDLELVNRSKRHEFGRNLHTNARLGRLGILSLKKNIYLFENESEPRLLTQSIYSTPLKTA